MREYSAVDLFCGIGGITAGLQQQGIPVNAGIDLDKSCKYAFEENNKSKFLNVDVSSLTGDDINKLYPDGHRKILIGCAPCQPFSSYSFKHKEKKNEQWKLLYSFANVIKESLPEIVSMENVPALLHYKHAPVFHDFCNTLNNLGYHVSYEIVNAAEYGVPQKRKRLILLASRLGEIKLIPPTHTRENYVTVKDTIAHLPEIKQGESHTDDDVHMSSELSEKNQLRIAATPYGGSWKDWPEELQLACHKKASGKSYASVYGRMKWDEPAPTMTTQCIGLGNGRFGHPEQNRAISLREAALFQTFPVDYKFFNPEEPKSIRTVARHVGNAVPVKLAEVIAISIKKHLESYA